MIKELAAELEARTIFPNQGQPAASTFYVEPVDLKIIKPYGAWDFDGTELIRVHHHTCTGDIEYVAHPTDPIMSFYHCSGFDSSTCQACDVQWLAKDLSGMALDDLQNLFYTELLEDLSELGDWPIKLCDREDGKLLFTTTRPLTREELLLKRAARMIEIRENSR